MKIEIDQSGRIEETNRDTILAAANEKYQFSVKISGRTKRRLLEEFRQKGKPKIYTIRTFAAGLFYLIINYPKTPEQIIIDVEYEGKNSLIKDIIGEKDKKLIDKISFRRIGRNSPAHILAINVFRGKKKPDKTVGLEVLRKLTLKKPR